MNLPNKITLSRIILVPVFMFFIIPFPEWLVNNSLLSFLHKDIVSLNNFILHFGNYIAAVIFIIAASTDRIDGYLARKNKQITKFGIFLDPIADKLLITAALIALVQRNEITGWAAMIIIGREFIVTGLRLIASGEGIVISAGKWGKIKLVAQVIAISASLLKDFPLSLITNFRFDKWAMLIAIFITIYSAYDYLSKNMKLINPSK
jgi:CDP-diacylglycerol---glycerol-3-phosphate 3-phosphatidyltransferase